MVFVSGYVLMQQMKYHDDKCKVMLAGQVSCNHAFTLIGSNCTIVTSRRILGVAAEKQQRSTGGRKAN